MINVVAMSGGKDSTALWLWAKRTGLNPVAVYGDTLFEWEGHYAHLDLLEARIGPIRRRPAKDSFLAATERKGTFPSRVRKWCTDELKIQPFRVELDLIRAETGDDVQVLVGVRAEESAVRATYKEREHSDEYDCDVWRPILDWTLEQVAAEHHLAAIPFHPLYHLGAERVGCFPCVNAGKAELALVASIQPSRIDEIREVERRIGQTMFTEDVRAAKLKRIAQGVPEEEAGPSVRPLPIDQVVEWANTARGGRQILLFQPPTGCVRWGLCDIPKSATEVRR